MIPKIEGKVVVGFPAVGKSALSFNYPYVIDLESSNFYLDSERYKDWYKVYCNLARDLCRQGFYVMVSSHKEVRDELCKHPASRQCIVYPSLKLEKRWITKLKSRYLFDMTEKNKKAADYVSKHYVDSINDMMNQQGFEHVVINDMGYELAEIIGYKTDIKKDFNIDEVI